MAPLSTAGSSGLEGDRAAGDRTFGLGELTELDGGEVEAVYDLHAGPSLAPRFTARDGSATLPLLSAVPLRFREVPITWRAWVEFWEQDQAGKHLSGEFLEDVRLLPAGTA